MGKKGRKNSKCRNTGVPKSNVTSTIACSGNGLFAPPSVIFPFDSTSAKYALEAKKHGIKFTSNKSGWQDYASFLYFLKDVFYEHVKTIGVKFPIALFFDNHRSHLSLEVYKFCRSVQIKPVCFFPNTTHRSSPLDLKVFCHLQREFEDAKDEYLMDQDTNFVDLLHFPKIYRTACDRGLLAQYAINGFRSAGLRPFEFDNMKTSDSWGKNLSEKVKII